MKVHGETPQMQDGSGAVDRSRKRNAISALAALLIAAAPGCEDRGNGGARGPHHPITPDYHRLTDRPPWRTTLRGWCTRYGNVLELVTDRDSKLAILNGGDALTLSFPADGLGLLDAGLTRDFFFYSVGWEKDADYNVVDGDTVGPLPDNDAPLSSSDDDWRLEYNTRWVPRELFDPRS